MNYTNIDQSNRLLELGLSLDTADMSWRYDVEEKRYYISIAAYKDYKIPKWSDGKLIPCWSVGQLFELTPDYIKVGENYYHIKVTRGAWPSNNWKIWYSATVPSEGKHRTVMASDIINPQEGKTITEAIYNMVVCLLENNYINKKR